MQILLLIIEKILFTPLHAVRHWGQHWNLLAGSCWDPTNPRGYLASHHVIAILPIYSFPFLAYQVIAVDADALNLAYIRRSLQKSFLWEKGAVRLICNAVR